MASSVTDSSRQLRTGDVLLMDRNCMTMKDPIGMAICLLNKTECPFDHIAMILKLSEEELHQESETGVLADNDSISPSDTYVLESNLNGITLRALENRLARSLSNQITARVLHMEGNRSEIEKGMLRHLKALQHHPYKSKFVGFLPSFLSPPDKMDRVKAAHKLHLLAREIMNIDHLVNIGYSGEYSDFLQRLRRTYIDAIVFLGDVYFPHLKRLQHRSEVPVLDWNDGHFEVDGSNTESTLFCSELIIRLWQGSGLVSGFPPASSFRPFDFLDDIRFNFINHTTFLGDMIPLKGRTNMDTIKMRRDILQGPDTLKEILNFYSRISDDVLLEGNVNHMSNWLIQSNTNQDVTRDLTLNIFSTGVLFALFGCALAPLRLRWIECQLGVMLRRGSLWSLSAGFLVRDVCCAVTQTLTASIALSAISYSQTNSVCPPRVLGPPLFETKLVDTRHAYYYVCAALLAANVVSHVATTPILNAVLACHFGPALPGPLPLLALMPGVLSLMPLSLFLPYQAAWVTWYETAGSAFIPTPSSLLRRRPDLLDTDEWRNFQYKALTGAFAATTAFDVMLYPLQARCWRSFLAKLYRPAPSPSYGRRLYAGYSYRFAGNMITMLGTTLSLSFLGVV